MSDNESMNHILADNMRFIGDVRFKQLTLLVAFQSLAGAGVAHYGSVSLYALTNIRQFLSVAAVFVTIIMWVFEVRNTINWVNHRRLNRNLWPRSKKDVFRIVNATNATLILHMSICAVWYYCAISWDVNCYFICLLTILLILVCVFTVYEYWSLWRYKEGVGE